MEIDIARATNDDIEECAHILCTEYNTNALQEGWTIDNAKKLFKYYLMLQSDLFFVVKDSGQVVGLIVGNIKPWSQGNCLIIEELCVKKEYRKEGIAKALMLGIFSEAIEKYDIYIVKGETYGTKKEMPFSWYTRLGFMCSSQTFIVEGNPRSIFKELCKK